MPSALIFFDEKESKIIEDYSTEWKLSKNETVREIVRRFGKIKEEEENE